MLISLTCLLIVLFAAATVFFRKPMNSVLSLIMAFFSVAGLMIQTGLEVIGFILIIVYVGAVAILFIFMLMMFPSDQESTQASTQANTYASDINKGVLHVAMSAALCVLMAYVVLQMPLLDTMNIVTFDVAELAISLYQEYHVGVLLMGGVLFVSMLVIVGLTLPRDYSRRDTTHTDTVREAKLPKRVTIAPKSRGSQ